MAGESSKSLLESDRSGGSGARVKAFPLRHLVRLLARQAAREVIARGVEAAASETRSAALDFIGAQIGSIR